MAFRYKIDILSELKKQGYSSYAIRKEKLFGETMLQKIRMGEMPSWSVLDVICNLLNCQISDIIEHYTESDGEEDEK